MAKQLGQEWVGVTISEGTHNPEDLIPTFLAVLSEADEDLAKAAAEVIEETKASEHPFDGSYHNLVNMFNLLEEYAPEGTWFGSHEGDGACFGFWIEEDWEDV